MIDENLEFQRAEEWDTSGYGGDGYVRPPGPISQVLMQPRMDSELVKCSDPSDNQDTGYGCENSAETALLITYYTAIPLRSTGL